MPVYWTKWLIRLAWVVFCVAGILLVYLMFTHAVSLRIKNWLEAFAYAATILGIPIAILLYFRDRQKTHQEREWQAYEASNNQYLAFLKLCLENAEFDSLEILTTKQPDREYTDRDRIEVIMYSVLMSIYERAYILYHDKSTELKKTQWTGWEEDIRCVSKLPTFRRLWSVGDLGLEWDRGFTDWMEKEILQEGSA